MKKKIFISGPMTGIVDYNFPAFNTAESALLKSGYEVVNPVKICRKYKRDVVLSDKTVFDKMIQDELTELKTCDMIYMLSGWEKSVGAKNELSVAKSLNLQITYEKEIGENE